MKKIITSLIVAVSLLFVAPVMAEKTYIPEGLVEISGGAYLYDDNGVFIVHTFKQLTQDKASEYISTNLKSKANLLPEAQDLADRLLKLNDVKIVKITPRQVIIQKYPLVKSYKSMIDDITKAFQSVYSNAPLKK